jgi:hypothetical protein
MLPLILGGLAITLGLVFLLASRGDRRRRRRILAVPTTRIKDAPATGTVEIQGRVVAGEEGTVRAPFSGRAAVWFRVTIKERGTRTRDQDSWYTRVTESDGRSFYVDDDSGEMASVIPNGANIVLDETVIASSGSWKHASPALEAFLHSRGIESRNWLDGDKDLRYDEELLAPGDPVYALGAARPAPAVPAHERHRTKPATRLVLSRGDGESGELLLTNKPEEELAKSFNSTFVTGVIFSVMGALLLLIRLLAYLT